MVQAARPAWVDGEMPDLFDASTHLMVVGAGPTVEEATVDAHAKMIAEVLGPENARPFVAVPESLQSFAEATATDRYVEGESQAYVRLVGKRVFIQERLEAWEAQMGIGALAELDPQPFTAAGQPVMDPSKHLTALATTLAYRRASAFVCERRLVVSTSTCTPASLGSIREAVKAFGEAITVRPAYKGGVPLRIGGGPEAPVAVIATWTAPGRNPVALAGLPVSFEGPSAEASIETDARGRAEWQPDAPDPNSKTAVRIDAEALLGADASLWANLASVEVTFRKLQPQTAQLALSIKENQRGAYGRKSLGQRLRQLGIARPVTLSQDQQDLVSLDDGPTRENLRALGEASEGAIDLVVLADFHTQFASRMRGRRVWHEAQGELVIYDVWSGAKIGPIDMTARENGLGEQAAGAKALRSLGAKLAEEAAKRLSEYYRMSPSAAVTVP